MRPRAPMAFLALALFVAGPLLVLAEPAPHKVIVQFASPPDASQRADLLVHGVGTFVSILPAAIGEVRPADEAWLAAQPYVERVQQDEALQLQDDLSMPLIRAGHPALDLGFDGTGIGVAVLDSGIDAAHPDFAGRIAADVTFAAGQWVPTQADTDGHGTHVAGIVAGSGAASNGLLQGVAPGASLVGMDFTRAFTTTTALLAFDWVLQHKAQYNLRVVTNSWGRADNNTWDPTDSLVRASNRLVDAGLVVLFSAGNKGPAPGTVSLEGQNPNVITVGAVDDAALVAGFSGRGPVLDAQGRQQPWVKPDLVADGVGILSTRSSTATGSIQAPILQPSQLPLLGRGGQGASQEAARYVELSGTSQAAPHVAGIVALMLQANPQLTPGQVHNLLRSTAIDLGRRGPDNDTGFGLVDARDAVLAAQGKPVDLGNILLAGGEESYEASGSLSSAAGQLLQTSPVVQVKNEGVVEAEVPVKPGATALRFDFAWTPLTAAFKVYLAGPADTLGPWSTARLVNGQRVVSGLADHPQPGVYKLIARPTGPVNADYSATMTVTIRERAQVPATLEPRYRAPEKTGPFDQLGSELQYELDRVGRAVHRNVPGPEPLLLLGLLALVALGTRPRRRSPSR